jgi:acetyl-CoA carboxylase biotin carboxyl carrier protein
MSIDEIKELIRVVQETGIAELELQRGDNRVRIRRATASTADIVVPVVSTSVTAAHAPILAIHTLGSTPATGPVPSSPAPTPSEDDHNVIVKSPIVGTYYDSPSPGAPPFVKIGDRVHSKQVLCIIESMKLMNEIEAEVAGTVVAKLVEDGRPVEYGESLFTIRPA